MKYQWLLLDADGTLFDYDKAEAMALQKTFGSYNVKFKPDYTQTYRRINDQIWQAFERGEITQEDIKTQRFRLLFEALEMKLPSSEFSARYLKHLGKGTYLLDGAEELLATLYGKIGLILITNGLKDVQHSRLARSSIASYFLDVVISEEIGAAKPDARIFEVAFEKMGNPDKESVLIVGDSLTSDMRGGYQYGIDTCWFNPSQRECDQDITIRYEIQALVELLPIVGLG